jgi:hypothetical protein
MPTSDAIDTGDFSRIVYATNFSTASEAALANNLRDLVDATVCRLCSDSPVLDHAEAARGCPSIWLDD